MNQITVKAPGRIVFFGEHQDYLGLPVIPAAIDLYLNIEGELNKKSFIELDLPDLNSKISFESSNIEYKAPRDYLRSGVKVLQDEGIIPKGKGLTAKVTSDIPIQAGLSSSSALCVAWITFLVEIFDQKLSPMEITKFAHQSEVLEFQEPGGMQDHMAISHGYVNYEEFEPIRCTKLLDTVPGIVVANSLERKDTLNTLATIKEGVNKGLEFLGADHVKNISYSILKNNRHSQSEIDSFSYNALKAAILNFEITKDAYAELKKGEGNIDFEYIGELMYKHHYSLRDYLDVSTPKLEQMINLAMNAGALGCKVTGSGNGGCMIALAPGNELEVAKAIQKAGAKIYLSKVASGVYRVQ